MQPATGRMYDGLKYAPAFDIAVSPVFVCCGTFVSNHSCKLKADRS